jgi:hypothetical protein
MKAEINIKPKELIFISKGDGFEAIFNNNICFSKISKHTDGMYQICACHPFGNFRIMDWQKRFSNIGDAKDFMQQLYNKFWLEMSDVEIVF